MNSEEEIRLRILDIAASLPTSITSGGLLENTQEISDWFHTGKPKESGFTEFCRHQTCIASNGTILFHMDESILRFIRCIEKADRLVVNAHRQFGTTTLLALYAAYFAITNPNSCVLWLSDSFSQSLHSMETIRRTAETMGIDPLVQLTKSQIVFANRSHIIGMAASENAGCGFSPDFIIIDNAAYISHSISQDLLRVLMPTMPKKVIVASVPNDTEGMFFDLWTRSGRSFRKLMLPWYENDRLTLEMMEKVEETIGTDAFRKNYCCEFVSRSQSE